jgi:hypothetical protein
MNAVGEFVREWIGCHDSAVSKAFLWSEGVALACYILSGVLFFAGAFLRDMKQPVFAKAGQKLLDYTPIIFFGAVGLMLVCGALFVPIGALVAVAISLVMVGGRAYDIRVAGNRLPHLTGWEANDAKKTIQDASRKIVRWSVSAVFFMAWFAVLVKLSSLSFWDLLAGD